MLHGRHAATRLAHRAHQSKNIQWRRGLLTLAIETSCDDTCVAILEKGSKLDGNHHTTAYKHNTHAVLHYNNKITIPNTGLGGIHPLEALYSHRSNLAKLVTESLDFLPEAAQSETTHRTNLIATNGVLKRKPDFITVTRGPGMRNNLSCGLDLAKGLAVAWQIPFVGVHHMQAHALTPRMVHATTQRYPTEENENQGELLPSLPFLTLLVSGGHTMLVHSTGLIEHQILATTADTAIGDALDKCGRLILPDNVKAGVQDTAFGKHLSHFAFPAISDFEAVKIPETRAAEIGKSHNQFGWQVQTPLSDTRKMAFSFAGITAQVDSIFGRRTEALKGELSLDERMLFARTVMGTAFEHLGSRTLIALELLRRQNIEIPCLVVSGGVAANDFLRYYLRCMLDIRGFANVRLVFPPVALCTDNAAMIAWCGMEMYEAGFRSDLGIKPLRKWSMDSQCQDGGILGVGGWIKMNDR